MRFVELGEILTESRIPSLHPNTDKRITVKLNLQGVEKRPLKKEAEGATKYFIRKAGQFIYGKQNLFKGAFGIIPKELDGFETTVDIPAFDISSECLPEWIYYFLVQGNFYKTLETYAKGTGSRRVHPENLYNVKILLPSLNEQKLILEKIKNSEKNNNLLSQEIENQEQYIKQLRQAILQEAVQGKLVPQDPNDEPASELLKKIKSEKEKLIKEGKIKKEKPLPPILEAEIPFDLPKGWEWARLVDIIKISSGDFLPSHKMNQLGAIPVYGGNGVTGIHDEYNVDKRTIVIGRVGFYCGSIHLTEEKAWITDNAFITKYSEENIYRGFLVWLLKGTNLKENDNATAQPVISGRKIYPIVVGIPPLEEQKRIVAKVDKLMKLCDGLEEQVKQSKKCSEQLMQAVLQEAFKVQESEELVRV